VASQAFWATDRTPPPALAARLGMIRAAFPPVDDVARRVLGHDAARLAALFHSEIYGET